MLIVYVVVLMLAFGAGSMTYVYAWRGNVRWGSASEYLRKSWPVFQPLNCLLYLFTRAYARKPLADAAARQIVLIGRHRVSGDHADDSQHDHELDQRKAASAGLVCSARG